MAHSGHFSIYKIVVAMLLTGLTGCSEWSPPSRYDWSNPAHLDTVTITLDNGVTLEMVYLEGGTFQMGSSPEDPGHYGIEAPVRNITLSGFWIGRHLVTQAQYLSVMGTNPAFFTGDNRPVERVSWHDAMAFCRTLSSSIDGTFTLPTEAQWEYACRAGTLTSFSFGDCLDTAHANYDGRRPFEECPTGDFRGETWDVGSGQPNLWGLYDMHGNLWEWCLNWHGPYSPGDAVNPAGPASGQIRILRGGAWDLHQRHCRSAHRTGGEPQTRWGNQGFRIVRLSETE